MNYDLFSNCWYVPVDKQGAWILDFGIGWFMMTSSLESLDLTPMDGSSLTDV
jgi:hypothetical protein